MLIPPTIAITVLLGLPYCPGEKHYDGSIVESYGGLKRQREYLREMGYKVNRDDDNGDGATK